MIGTQENIEQLRHGVFVRSFVKAQAQLPAPQDSQVDLCRLSTLDDRGLSATDLQRQRVEEVFVQADNAAPLQTRREDAGQPLNTLGNLLQPFRTVVDRVETGDVGQQHLGGADVRVGLLPADVLLTGLQGHAQRGIAARVFRNADDASWNRSFVFITTGKKRRVGAAVPHGHAEPLG